MIDIENKIEELGKYFQGFERYNDAWVVKVMYPSKWGVYPSQDKKTIQVAPSEDAPDLYYYYADAKKTNLESIFDLIKETIEMNETVALKLKLMAEKVNELKDIFSKESYNNLLSLKFVFDKTEKEPSVKRKKAVSKKAKTDEAEKEKKEPLSNHKPAVVDKNKAEKKPDAEKTVKINDSSNSSENKVLISGNELSKEEIEKLKG